jgi:hypothetical protein
MRALRFAYEKDVGFKWLSGKVLKLTIRNFAKCIGCRIPVNYKLVRNFYIKGTGKIGKITKFRKLDRTSACGF